MYVSYGSSKPYRPAILRPEVHGDEPNLTIFTHRRCHRLYAVDHVPWLIFAYGVLKDVCLAGVTKGTDGAEDPSVLARQMQLENVRWSGK
jgi:hypothetical protein